jgi:hypothetical protein
MWVPLNSAGEHIYQLNKYVTIRGFDKGTIVAGLTIKIWIASQMIDSWCPVSEMLIIYFEVLEWFDLNASLGELKNIRGTQPYCIILVKFD